MSVRVVVSPEVLDVFIEGWDRVWGLRSRLERLERSQLCLSGSRTFQVLKRGQDTA